MISRLTKYFGLFCGFFKASAISDLEYRLNVVVKVLTDVVWYAAQLSVFEVLFRNVNQVSGWTIETTRVFIAVLFVVDSIWMLLFSENLDRLSDRVRKGELDLLLAKPVNSQFMLSFQKVSTAYVINVCITTGFLIWAFAHARADVEWLRLPLLLIMIPCSLGIAYGMRFFFSATALIFARAENINYVWYQVYRLGMRPDALYPAWLKYTVLTIIPVGFLASVPARLILGLAAPHYIVAAFLIAIFIVYLSTRFWKYALTFYSSASS